MGETFGRCGKSCNFGYSCYSLWQRSNPHKIAKQHSALLGDLWWSVRRSQIQKNERGGAIMGLTFGLAVFAAVMIGWAYFANQAAKH